MRLYFESFNHNCRDRMTLDQFISWEQGIAAEMIRTCEKTIKLISKATTTDIENILITNMDRSLSTFNFDQDGVHYHCQKYLPSIDFTIQSYEFIGPYNPTDLQISNPENWKKTK